MDLEQIATAVAAVEDSYDADVFLYNASISDDGFAELSNAVAKKRQSGDRPNCLLILVTYGGWANSAYQIARLLQSAYKCFYLFTPSKCKSAGTIVSLGANSLIMDTFSELGPLDVQLADKDEIGDRKSGLLTRGAFEALAQESFDLFSHHMLNIKAASEGLVSFRLAAELASKMTTDLLSPVFSQLNPDIIGSDHRDLQVASEYGKRLADVSENVRPQAIQLLVRGYPAHDFIIDKREASQKLFRHVNEPSDALYDLVGHISTLTHASLKSGIVIALENQYNDKDQDGDQDGDQEDDQSPDGGGCSGDNDTRDQPVDEGGSADRGSDTEAQE